MRQVRECHCVCVCVCVCLRLCREVEIPDKIIKYFYIKYFSMSITLRTRK
jgi:hypothetical protein